MFNFEGIKDTYKAMKFKCFSHIFLFTIAAMAVKGQEETKEIHPYVRLTKSFIGAVKRNMEFKNTKFFDSTFYGKMIEAQADKTVADFMKEYGPIQTIEKTEIDTQGCKMVTATAVKVAKGKFLWYHHYDQAQYIQRFYIDTFSKQFLYKAEPLENSNFTRREVSIEPNAFIRLPGSIYIPNGNKKSPLVILVHGSGPHDRTGSMGKNKVYLEIALQLVQKGVSVLIYDKRTYVYQFRDPFPMDSMDYLTETVDDAVEAFKVAKKISEIDSTRIYIAGHSQGGLCGPLIAKKCIGLKGLILLAAPARSLLEIIPEQIAYINGVSGKNKEETEKNSNAMNWLVKNALKPDLNLKSKEMLPFGARPKYWLFDRNYKVLEEAKTLTLPIILIQGGRDYNVTKKDFDLWISAMTGKNNFKSVWLENCDHLFFEGQGMAKPEDATLPKHVSKSVGNKIVEFVNLK